MPLYSSFLAAKGQSWSHLTQRRQVSEGPVLLPRKTGNTQGFVFSFPLQRLQPEQQPYPQCREDAGPGFRSLLHTHIHLPEHPWARSLLLSLHPSPSACPPGQLPAREGLFGQSLVQDEPRVLHYEVCKLRAGHLLWFLDSFSSSAWCTVSSREQQGTNEDTAGDYQHQRELSLSCQK